MSPLQRVRFEEGRLLRHCDLEAVVRGFELRRRLHVTAVHRACGVALGFGLRLDTTGESLVVEPGLGYDRRGRELLSGRAVTVPAPTLDGVRVLTVARGCGLEWRWLEPDRVRDELVLCRCAVTVGKLGDPDLSVRRGARGPGGRLAAGRQGDHLKPTIHVDTSAAGFRETPFYFATLSNVHADLLVGVTGASATSFDLDIRTVQLQSEATATPEPLTVEWVGVEPSPDH